MEEKLSVLVVDDDREIVESIAIYLSRENLTIYKAYDGLQALDIVSYNPFDFDGYYDAEDGWD